VSCWRKKINFIVKLLHNRYIRIWIYKLYFNIGLGSCILNNKEHTLKSDALLFLTKKCMKMLNGFNWLFQLASSLHVFRQNFIRTSHVSRACYMRLPSDHPWLRRLDNIWWCVQVIKLLIMRSSPGIGSNARQKVFIIPNTFQLSKLSHPHPLPHQLTKLVGWCDCKVHGPSI
jgi:hypothetical protein